MRQGYLIEKYNHMASAYTCRRLLEEAKKLGLELRMVGAQDCTVKSEGVFCAGEKLEHRDFAILRYKTGKAMEAVRGLCDFSYNSPACFDRYVNKFYQLQDLQGHGIPLPKYVLTYGNESLFDGFAEELGLPFVMKGLASSMGREIFLIKDLEDYRQVLAQYPADKEWLLEEFIATSKGRDLRLYALRGEVIGAMIRSSADDFRSNVALGAKVSGVPISPEMRRIAKELFVVTGYDYAGIDLLFGKDDSMEDLIFCEMNVMAGIQGMEEATGVNVAGAIIGMIRDDFRDA
ncbi:MAG: RimK family alpha-L-glutamate ligase [Lachnospiraceae bacterium]|nr:RimK family alpha-L-glutamate ligase [Lachnospiraceae bacterium]